MEHIDSPVTDGNDLLGILKGTELEGRPLSRLEIMGFCMTLLVAGNETTRTLISGGVEALHSVPDQRADLAVDPSLLPAAVEELLRWVTPIQAFGRTAAVDTCLGGAEIPAGDFVVMLYASGNRDEAAFGPTAAQLDVRRPVSPPTWPSASGSTSAWVPPWPDWRPGSSSRSCSAASPPTSWRARWSTSGRRWSVAPPGCRSSWHRDARPPGPGPGSGLPIEGVRPAHRLERSGRPVSSAVAHPGARDPPTGAEAPSRRTVLVGERLVTVYENDSFSSARVELRPRGGPGQVPRRTGQAAGPGPGRHPRPRPRRAVRPLPGRSLHPARGARPGRRRGRRGDRRRGDRRDPGRRPAPQGRRRADPDRRPGGRDRRHLVLEPVSRRDVRCRVPHLPADARGARLRPHPALRLRRGDPGPPAGGGRPVRPGRRRPVPHRGHPGRVGRRHLPLADQHRPG